jgi:hypothetical protein
MTTAIKVPRKLSTMVNRVGAYLVDDKKLLSEDEFDDATSSYYALCALLEARPKLGLAPQPLMFWLDNIFPRLLVSDLLEARAAWYGEPLASAGELVAREPTILQDTLKEIPKGFTIDDGRKLGSIAVELGWLNKTRLAEAVKLQKMIKKETGVQPLVGSLLVARGDLTPASLYQVLALQLGVPFKQFDLASLDRVKKKFLAARKRAKPKGNW